ncbi:MAG: hypothetical protein ACHQFZ_08555 [Acidimicrobiales bacterium]
MSDATYWWRLPGHAGLRPRTSEFHAIPEDLFRVLSPYYTDPSVSVSAPPLSEDPSGRSRRLTTASSPVTGPDE